MHNMAEKCFECNQVIYIFFVLQSMVVTEQGCELVLSFAICQDPCKQIGSNQQRELESVTRRLEWNEARVLRGKIIWYERRSGRVQWGFSEGEIGWGKIKRSENCCKSNNNRFKIGKNQKDMINSCHYFNWQSWLIAHVILVYNFLPNILHSWES